MLWQSILVADECCTEGEGVFCGTHSVEFRIHVICGISDAECSAKHTL